MKIDMNKAVPAAAQAMADTVRKDHGLPPMPLDDMPRVDQETWRRRAVVALDAAFPFIV